jgi:hypothetical protein
MTFMVRLIKGCIIQEEHIEIDLSETEESEDDSLHAKQKKSTLKRDYNKSKREIENETKKDWRIDDDEFEIEKIKRLSDLRKEYVAKGLVLPNNTPVSTRSEAPTVDENDIHRMIDSQLQVYTDLHVSLVFKDSNIFGDAFEEKKERY